MFYEEICMMFGFFLVELWMVVESWQYFVWIQVDEEGGICSGVNGILIFFFNGQCFDGGIVEFFLVIFVVFGYDC